MSSVPDYLCPDVTVDVVKEALETFGCCVLRHCVPMDVIQSIRTVVLERYAEMDARFEAQTMSETEYRHCYRYGIVRPFEEDLRTTDGRLMRSVMLNILSESILGPLLQVHFGSDINLLVPSSHVRRVKPGSGVPYHQDSSVMKLHETRILNCWFPLDVAGGDSPTMEVVPVGLKHLLERGGHDDALYGHLQIGQETLEDRFSEIKTWTPTLMPGDVLLLDSYTVHRTHQTDTMSKQRCDFEMRFASRPSIEMRDDVAQIEI